MWFVSGAPENEKVTTNFSFQVNPVEYIQVNLPVFLLTLFSRLPTTNHMEIFTSLI